MAASALEEKINKIRQQNEEIRRRHEEVEEDKKNAAKLNALVQMVPSTDWPERKEPEFCNLPRANNKVKLAKEHHEHPQQYHSASGEGRKVHTFAQGQGPPPDPKYNFLADAERETGNVECMKETSSNRGQKHSRGTFKRKSGGKDGIQRDYRANRGSHKEEHQPEYEAWRAERNRIDEDRISRQRTAEGNWRREWDNDKAHVDEVTRSDGKLGDYIKEHKDFDRRYQVNGNDYVNYNRGASHRSYRGNSRHFHNNFENRSNGTYHQDGYVKNPASSSSEERTVVATDKSIKVTLNHGNVARGPVMSVKVNSPSIAGTGRVGPRQRSRITYSSHSDIDAASPDTEPSRPKYEDKNKGIYHDNLQKSSNSRKSQPPPRKKDFRSKSPYFRKKDIKREDANGYPQKQTESRRESKESQKSYQPKSQKLEENINAKPEDEINEKKSNVASDKSNINSTEAKDKDNENNDPNSGLNDVKNNENNDPNSGLNDVKNNEIHVNQENEFILQNSDLSASNGETEIDICETNEQLENKSEKLQVIQAAAVLETIEADLIVSSAKDSDESEIESAKNSSYVDVNNDNNNVREIKEQNSSIEKTEAINNNCDSKQTENVDEEKNDIKHKTKNSPKEKNTDKITILSSIDVSSIETKENNELSSDNNIMKENDISIAEDIIGIEDEQINTGDQQGAIKSADKAQERINDDNKKENGVANDIMVDKIEFPKEDIQVEDKEAVSLEIEVKTEK